MATKKALFEVIAYPDSSDLQKVLNVLTGAGAQYHYCTHDSCVDKDGNPIKTHTHILCGWSCGAPDWAQFVEILKSCGAVCPGERGRYDPESAKVYDSERADQYLEHRDPKSVEAGKHDYTGKSVYSEGWRLSDYVTYNEKRKQAKQCRDDDKAERAEDCKVLFDLISDHGITEYCTLVDLLRSTNPDLLAALISNAYPVKSYIDSKRGYERAVMMERERELLKENRELKQEIKRLKQEIVDANDTLRETIERTREQYALMFGETAPEWAEV